VVLGAMIQRGKADPSSVGRLKDLMHVSGRELSWVNTPRRLCQRGV
jgi:hypothetical protein